MSSASNRLTLQAAAQICREALQRAGASAQAAAALTEAAMAAETAGRSNVGIAHLADHLEALKAGRIKGEAVPVISRPAAAIFHSDAYGGIAQLGFDMAFDALVAAARELGIALFAQHNAYTCGALGWFASRLANEGLVAIAATNGPALMAGSGGTGRVFSTNPLAFAAPRENGAPLLIDQASSETAFVNVRRAAKEGRALPPGWALDAKGEPTTDAAAAVKGTLLAYGGARGANIALMVEILAAGLTGANWSLDAPSFMSGAESPGSGLLVVAIEPKLLDPQFELRVGRQLRRLNEDHGIHIPGASRGEAARKGIRIEQALLDRLLA
jgi:(2R)-3-sulfolactate dehydrogenase (NADP+)